MTLCKNQESLAALQGIFFIYSLSEVTLIKNEPVTLLVVGRPLKVGYGSFIRDFGVTYHYMSYIDKEGNIQDGEDLTAILEPLKKFLREYYIPVKDPKDAELHFSTRDIHQQLLKIFPNAAILTADIVANWLHEAGFSYYDYGEMKLEWMMKKA